MLLLIIRCCNSKCQREKDISDFFVLISSILGTIHENFQSRSQWKSTVILTSLGRLWNFQTLIPGFNHHFFMSLNKTCVFYYHKIVNSYRSSLSISKGPFIRLKGPNCISLIPKQNRGPR